MFYTQRLSIPSYYSYDLCWLLQNKTALNGSNGCFVSFDEDDDIVCSSKSVKEGEVLRVSQFRGM